MNKLKQRACRVLACAAVLAPLAADCAEGAHAQDAVDAGETPATASVLMLAAGVMLAGCMRRREPGLEDFGE